MRWYFQVLGGHTHVRVFMHGANCGTLIFRNDEFEIIRRDHAVLEAASDDIANPLSFMLRGGFIKFAPEPSGAFTCQNCGRLNVYRADIPSALCLYCNAPPERAQKPPVYDLPVNPL